MKYALFVSIIAAFSCTAACIAGAQPMPQTAPGHTIITTRLVATFSDLEEQWLTAVQKRDAAVLDRLLGDEFEVWTAAPPGAPMPREDWQAQAFSSQVASFRISQMAVRGVSEDIAIASFVLQETISDQGKESHHRSFIVDVWTKTREGWLCTDRYTSEVPTPASSAATDKKPTGKR